MDCLFCRIAAGEIPSTKVYEDDDMLAFRDINPVAPVHVIVIPKKHIASMDAIDASNSAEAAKIFEKIPVIAKLGGCGDGYRVVSNCGPDGGQSVPHLHFHVLGGMALPWPVFTKEE